MSGGEHFLTEIIPAGPLANKAAERARTKLLAQVDERRNPRTSATVAHFCKELELQRVGDFR